jgi:hypothetical protein
MQDAAKDFDQTIKDQKARAEQTRSEASGYNTW